MVELISRDEHEKLYLQVFDILKRKIESGEWKPGKKIPTEEQLCKMFNVSRATVRNAVLELVRHGYLIRKQGKGTFVRKNFISEGLLMTTIFKKLWVEDESIFRKEVLAKTVIMPVGDLSKELGVFENKHIIYLRILWQSDNEPSILQESFVPFNICSHLLEEDVETQSIIDLFEKKYSIKITKVHNFFELNSLDKELAQFLQIAEDTPVILITQKVFSGNTVVLLNKFYKKNDKNKLFIAFQRQIL
ncbi:GntR family transcriptional regulator [Thermodesulfobacterium sp. TA1]|uniref:GntR family transcriptional regulator n=1 Tax=Thermodesulfobacterium sp. TA1 TaxID=2234087 RepID=UPI001232411C|nr:GntR family transcriptional regulator [Thermodesulfobacterium sp. TA1]QER42625.1 GntR family transcriptional regulator [Thermodesulfobacterium sp. TA1]